MTALVVIERTPDGIHDLSLQAIAFARTYAANEPVDALVVGDSGGLEGVLGEHGISTVHVAEHQAFSSYAPAAVARAALDVIGRTATSAVVAAGNERGNEVLAHVAAIGDLPFAANCLEATAGDPALVTRVRWGGSLLEEARLHGSPALITVQPHSVAPEADHGEPARVELRPATGGRPAMRVHERVGVAAGGGRLADAKVVVRAARRGFHQRLRDHRGAAASRRGRWAARAPTAGWNHTDQSVQRKSLTSTSRGISGATALAGCGAAILAVNTDGGPHPASADYAVIGDLHRSSGDLGRVRRRLSDGERRVRSRARRRGRGRSFLSRDERCSSPRCAVGVRPPPVGRPAGRQRDGDRPRRRSSCSGPGLVHAFIFWGFVLFPTSSSRSRRHRATNRFRGGARLLSQAGTRSRRRLRRSGLIGASWRGIRSPATPHFEGSHRARPTSSSR